MINIGPLKASGFDDVLLFGFRENNIKNWLPSSGNGISEGNEVSYYQNGVLLLTGYVAGITSDYNATQFTYTLNNLSYLNNQGNFVQLSQVVAENLDFSPLLNSFNPFTIVVNGGITLADNVQSDSVGLPNLALGGQTTTFGLYNGNTDYGYYSSLTASEFNAITVGDTISFQNYSFSILPNGPQATVTGKAITAFGYEIYADVSPNFYADSSNGTALYIRQDFSYPNNVVPLFTINASGYAGVLLNNPIVIDNKYIGTVTVNPTVEAVSVEINGVPSVLPTGSIVRNTTTGQKFIKIDGDEFAYEAILITPPTEWGWSQEGLDAWVILQNL